MNHSYLEFNLKTETHRLKLKNEAIQEYIKWS
jgi:hypothetical protein